MADNVSLNAASGTFLAATDEVQVGGTNPLAQVQFVKLVDGTLNGTDPIAGSLANGLLVAAGSPNAILCNRLFDLQPFLPKGNHSPARQTV